jgi:hypothetical protein
MYSVKARPRAAILSTETERGVFSKYFYLAHTTFDVNNHIYFCCCVTNALEFLYIMSILSHFFLVRKPWVGEGRAGNACSLFSWHKN